MGNADPKQQRQIFTIGAPVLGIDSRSAHMIPPGRAKNIENFIFKGAGIKTTLGWETITNGFDGRGSYPGSASGGLDNTSYGTHVGYFNNDTGKVNLFAKSGFCDTATGRKFVNATTNTFARQDSKDWLGVIYFAGAWLVYNELKIYELTIADGTLTSKVVFASDLSSNHSPIIKIVNRFGQLWVASKPDKVFWSDVGAFVVGEGAQVSNQSLEMKVAVWQTLKSGRISDVSSPDDHRPVIEFMYYVQLKTVGQTPFNNDAHDHPHILDGTNYAYISDETSALSDADVLIPFDKGKSFEEMTIASSGTARATVNLTANVSSGTRVIKVVNSGVDNANFVFWEDDEITISDSAPNSETAVIKSVLEKPDARYITLRTDLNASYTTGASAKITHSTVTKLTFTSNWDTYLSRGAILKKAKWALTTRDLDYDVSYDPDNDPDATGHIRLHDIAKFKHAEAIRCTYYKHNNYWTSGQSGYQNIATSKGDNLDIVEGPNYKEEEGADVLYVFKTNGDIHAVTGHPDTDGSAGTMDVRFIASGLKVRPKTALTTREGIYFCVLDGIDYDVYFIPHGDKLLAKEQVVKLTEHYNFDTDIPFDDSSYTLYERTAIIGGNMYLIVFPNSTSGLPSTNGYMYVGQAYKNQDGSTDGRWARLPESTEDEYESASDITVASGGRANTLGFYLHDGELTRVYQLKTGHDYAGNTRYYEIAKYGWRGGGEECKSKYVFTKDNGNSTYTTAFSTNYFWAKVKYGMMTLGGNLNISRILFDIDVIGGALDNGIDYTLSIYTDLDYVNAITGSPFTVSDLTDDTSNLKILTELRKHDGIQFNARYFQFDMKFDNIRYNTHPAFIYFRSLAIEAAVLSDKGLLSEENH